MQFVYEVFFCVSSGILINVLPQDCVSAVLGNRKYQAEETFVTLTRSLVINLQSFITFGGIVLDFGILQNFILLHTLVEQHCFVISWFRRFYVCSFSLTLCSLIFQKYAARLNFFDIVSSSFNMLTLCWIYMVADLAKVYNWGCSEEPFLKHSNVLILFASSANGGFINGSWYLMNLRIFLQ